MIECPQLPAPLCVSKHAVERYRERVADLPDAEIRELLRGPAIAAAARFGAPFVRLPGGQRVVLAKFDIVTVLPAHTWPGTLDPRRQR